MLGKYLLFRVGKLGACLLKMDRPWRPTFELAGPALDV